MPLLPPEAELRPRHPPVHVFNVLTLGLKVVGGVIRAGHEDLEKTQEKDEDHQTKQTSFPQKTSSPDSSSRRRWEPAGDARTQTCLRQTNIPETLPSGT